VGIKIKRQELSIIMHLHKQIKSKENINLNFTEILKLIIKQLNL